MQDFYFIFVYLNLKMDVPEKSTRSPSFVKEKTKQNNQKTPQKNKKPTNPKNPKGSIVILLKTQFTKGT